MTRLQELLEVLSEKISPELRDDIILDNFDSQDNNYYEIDGEVYYVFDENEVIVELAKQYEEDVKTFLNRVSQYEDLKHIVDELYVEEIADNLARNFNYTDLLDYEFIDSPNRYYIYKGL